MKKDSGATSSIEPYGDLVHSHIRLNAAYNKSSSSLPLNLPRSAAPCFDYDFKYEKNVSCVFL